MFLPDVEILLETVAKAKCLVTLLLWGKHGVGKSAIVKKVAKSIGYKCIVIHLAQRDPVDVIGIPYTYKDEDGADASHVWVTDHHLPKWFARALKKGKVIIFLDEFNQAKPDVQGAVFELVLDHKLNDEQLPDDVMVVAACNPCDPRYTTFPMSDALVDRFVHVHVKPNTQKWLDWARQPREDNTKKQNIHPDVIRFIESDKNALFAWDDKKDNEFPVKIERSERSAERLSRIHELGLPRQIEMECIQGIIGPEYAAAFMKSLTEVEKPITVEEILNLSEETIDRIKKYSEPENPRLDSLNVTIKDLVTAAYGKNTPKEVKDDVFKHHENVLNFMCLIPKDKIISVVHGIYNDRRWADKIFNHKVLKPICYEINELLKKEESARGSR